MAPIDPLSGMPPEYEDEVRFRAKRELRKRMRALRTAHPPRVVAQRSAAITAAVLAMPAWTAARTVALFMAMPDEVQTSALVAAARASGKRVALPVVVSEQPVLAFRAPSDGGIERPLVMSAYGIDEPGEDAPLVDLATIDFVLIPALAADPRGHRLGYGRGYYDHTLPLATAATRAVVAFDFQLIAEVPIRAADVAAHWIVTDRRVMRAEGAAADG